MKPVATVILIILASTLVLLPDATAYAASSVQIVDSTGDVGDMPSLELDVAGNPVISYYDETNDMLKIAHCDDPNCAPGGDSFATSQLYTTNNVGTWSSLELDSAGNPVISFHDVTLGALVVMHCNDANCVFPGDSFMIVDATIGTGVGSGQGTSLELDASGNPVVAYFDNTNDDLKVLHCNDPNCDPSVLTGNGPESITSPDTAGIVGIEPSLALDAVGNPVVSYADETNDMLRIMHCNDPNCDPSVLTGNGPESITSPAAMNASPFHRHSPLVLDAAGNPVVAYHSGGGFLGVSIRVLHCDDPNCDGIGESDTQPDPGFFFVWRPSLVLDSLGRPIIAYSSPISSDQFGLRIMHCDDANCAGGGESVADADIAFPERSSLLLDANMDPVVAYYDGVYSGSANMDLKLLHCGDDNCAAVKDADGDGCPDVNEQQVAPNSEVNGGRRDRLNPHDYFNPTHDGLNRVDDILKLVDQYFIDDNDGNPGQPPYAAGYDPDTDRTLLGPNAWNLGPPDGLQRSQDIIHVVKQFFHDCP